MPSTDRHPILTSTVVFPFSSVAPEDANRDLVLLNRFAVSLLRQQTLEDLLWSLTRSVGELLGFEDCVLYLVYGDTLVQRAAYGPKNPREREIWSPLRIPIGHGITGTVAKTGVSELIHDVRKDPRYIADQIQGASEICVPIRYHDRVIGVIDAEDEAVAAFTVAQREMLLSFANVAAPRIAGALSEQALAEANQQLETRIAERTSQLERAIEALKEESAQREVLQRRNQANERLESLGTFAGGLTHDFNNLVHGIQTHVELAADSAGGDDESSSHLSAAIRGCGRITELIGQLSTFAEGGAPKKTLQNLEALLRRAVGAAADSCGAGMPRFDYSESVPEAAVDVTQLDQAVQGLVINAIEACDGRSDRVSIEVRSVPCANGPGVEIVVRDEGIGVEPSIRSRVFDPYFTTKESGAGLGLAMAYSIVHRHGGTLRLDEVDGIGAVFRLTIPAVASRTNRAEAEPLGSEDQRSLRILLMDDDELVRRATTILLERIGMSVESYPDGRAAVDAFEAIQNGESPFDVALLDLSVPNGLGGLETLPLLRGVAPDLPAIVVSGYSDTPALAHPERFGFQAALNKPFTLNELREVLSRVVQTPDN